MPDDELKSSERDAPVFKVGESDNFLGDPKVIQRILRNVATEFAFMSEPAAFDILITKFARVMLGKDKNFFPVRNWNAPGGIDEFAAKWLGSSETDPMERMKHVAVMLCNEMIELGELVATPGVLPEQWHWTAETIFERYTTILLGIDPATFAMTDAGDDPGSIKPWPKPIG